MIYPTAIAEAKIAIAAAKDACPHLTGAGLVFAPLKPPSHSLLSPLEKGRSIFGTVAGRLWRAVSRQKLRSARG